VSSTGAEGGCCEKSGVANGWGSGGRVRRVVCGSEPGQCAKGVLGREDGGS